MNKRRTRTPQVLRPLSEVLTESILESISDGVFTIDDGWRITSFMSFVAGEVDAVLAAFLEEKLPSPELSLPGCYGRQTRRRFRGARNQGCGRSRGWGRKGSHYRLKPEAGKAGFKEEKRWSKDCGRLRRR